ncbi:MAG: hypothetical protein Q8916_00160 [Bacteroidota bacterium]|nr:hypothetical protein [Bacteroidota bacterium]MDP4228799.1 hypothetical protein [Bacteroidota bacterium]MDP4237187.1 hypothetical protein [Bacteroidota bacterium]
MTLKDILPRLVVIIIFATGAIFAYIESIYMRDHAASLGEKGSSVATWMWIYRILAMALALASSYIAGGYWRR